MNHRNSYKRRRMTGSTSSTFPILSVTSLVILVTVLSMLSALCLGVTRSKRKNVNLDLSSELMSARNAGINGISSANDLQHHHDSSNNKYPDASIHSLKDLPQSQLHPVANTQRYIVQPPHDDEPINLVTCQTTKGYLHIVVHTSWAPLGAERFLQMVNAKYFSSKVALMRCIRNFICQFGIAGDPSYNKDYRSFKDDPNWLPEGPTHRTNALGVKRFAKGFMAYAGGGNNSRSNQFIVALGDNERLGGGSPWEGECNVQHTTHTVDRFSLLCFI